MDVSPSPEAPSSGSSELLLGLELWEAGLVAANILALLALVACVCTAVVCVARRRVSPAPRVASDPEQLPLKEIDNDVDYSTVGVEVPFGAVVFQELLHRGTFKTVHRAIINCPARGMSGLEVAVKRLKDESSELGMKELMAELYLLRSIQDKAGTHPNVVSLVGVTTAPSAPCLLLEFVPHGTLDRFLWSLKKGPVPEWYLRHLREVVVEMPYNKHVARDLMMITLQVADAMCFLSSHGFVHHDLSTRNVMVGHQLQAKVGNPGVFHEGYYYSVTEREHFMHDMAPECLWEKRFTLYSDIWSFGVLLYKVVTLETNPYPGVPPRDLYHRIVVGGERPRLLSSFSNDLYFLLQRCWQVVPTNRPTFPDIFTGLKSLTPDPSRHIILKISREEFTPAGYVSENGQVFLHYIPPYILQPGPTASRRLSNPHVSSLDDTVYSRETAESLLYLYSSEVESTYTTRETEEEEEEGSNSQDSCDHIGNGENSRENLVHYK